MLQVRIANAKARCTDDKVASHARKGYQGAQAEAQRMEDHEDGTGDLPQLPRVLLTDHHRQGGRRRSQMSR